MAVGAIGLCLLAWLAVRAGSADEAPPTEASQPAQGAPPTRLEADKRVAWLLADCAHPGPFTADTSDPVALLINKLENGQRDPLLRAKIELAELGDAALKAVEQEIDVHYANVSARGRLANLIEVLTRMNSKGARGPILRCLDHPVLEVRLAAVRGMRRHAEAADYERLQALMPTMPSVREQLELLDAMQTADAARLEGELAGWIEVGEKREFWRHAAGRIAKRTRGAHSDHFRSKWKVDDPEVAPLLAACAANGGDEEARDFLARELESEDLLRRSLSVGALIASGELGLLSGVLREDPDPTLRSLAAEAWAEAPASSERTRLMTIGLADEVEAVRGICLGALIESGDAAATDEALAALERGELETAFAMRALRPGMGSDPALAKRVLSILSERYGDLAERPLPERVPLAMAIGLVPGSESARLLMDEGRRVAGKARNMRAHRWFARQAGNAGAEGRAFLAELWLQESDPLRRLDLIEAVGFGAGDATRAFLRAVVTSQRATDYERLYATDRLVRLGPAAELAPFLKRAVRRAEESAVVRALRCLLWKWYG